jgi:TPP-dependent 2-oxoacid decarboxylase
MPIVVCSADYIGNRAYEQIHQRVTCATTVLNDAKTAVAEIDRVLNALLHFSQPV